MSHLLSSIRAKSLPASGFRLRGWSIRRLVKWSELAGGFEVGGAFLARVRLLWAVDQQG